MICPECHSEYIEGIDVCADCKVSLVDEEPLELPLKEILWVPLHTLDGKIYADMVAEVLRDKGIPNYIKSDWLTSAWSISAINVVGGAVTIYVPETNKDEADAILNDIVGR